MPLQSNGLVSRHRLDNQQEKPKLAAPSPVTVLKANPYHDKEGYFTSKDKAVSISKDKAATLHDEADQLREESWQHSNAGRSTEARAAGDKMRESLANFKKLVQEDATALAKSAKVTSGTKGSETFVKANGKKIGTVTRVTDERGDGYTPWMKASGVRGSGQGKTYSSEAEAKQALVGMWAHAVSSQEHEVHRQVNWHKRAKKSDLAQKFNPSLKRKES